MMNNKRHPWKLIPAIIMMAGIFIHSSMNGDMSTLESDALIRILGLPLTDTMVVAVRKCAHLMEYAALGASMYLLTDDWQQARADRKQETRGRLSLDGPFGKAWFASALYAVMDEIHQHFVPGRSGEITDVLIDSIGCLIGVVIMSSILHRRDDFHD